MCIFMITLFLFIYLISTPTLENILNGSFKLKTITGSGS